MSKVCNPKLSGTLSPQMKLAQIQRDLTEATREKNPSLLKQLNWAQTLANGFIQIDNLATSYPELKGWVNQVHIGEKLRSLQSHNYNDTMRVVGDLSDKDSGAITRLMEALDAGMKPTENPDGSTSVTATQNLVGMKKGETFTLNPKLTKVWKDSRKILDNIYDDVIRATKTSLKIDPDATTFPDTPEGQAAKEVVELLEEARRENYLPHVRKGRYAVEFYDPAPLQQRIKELRGKPDSEGEIQQLEERLRKYGGAKRLEAYDTRLDRTGTLPKIKTSQSLADSRAKELESQGMKNIKVRDLQAEKEMFDAYLPEMDSLSAIDYLFQAILTPDKNDARGELLRVMDRLKAEREGGRQGRLKRRKDIPGWLRPDNYDTYFRSTFPAYVFSMSDYIANKATEGGRRDAINAISSPDVQRIAKKAEEYLHTDESTVAKLKNLTFLYTLGGNISSALIQPTQLLHTTWPLLSGIGGTGNAAVAISKAAGIFLANIKFSSLDPAKILDIDKLNIPQDEKDLIRRMFAEGMAEALLTRDQAPSYLARSQDPDLYALGKNVGKVMDVSSFAFAAMETVNRLATGLATYRMMKDPKAFKRLQKMAQNVGDKISTPIDAVEWMVRESQFTMGKPFRAQYMRGPVGGLAFQFMPFTFKMLGFQRRAMEYYGGKGILSTDVGKKILGLHLLGVFATAGLWGLPFASAGGDLLEKLLKLAGPSMGISPVALRAELREALQGVLQEVPGLGMLGTPAELADYVFSGPFRALGVDISKRTAMEVIPENVLNLDLLNMGPFLSAVVGGGADAVNYWKRGMEWMAIASLLPVSVRNVARSAAMQEEGFITPGKLEPTLPAREMRDLADIMKVSIGFTPTKVAEAREAKQETKELGEKMDSLRQSYSDKIARAMAKFAETKDPSHRQEALQLRSEIVEFDKGRPLRDRIIQDPESFNSIVSRKVKSILYPQAGGVPKSVEKEYFQRIQ